MPAELRMSRGGAGSTTGRRVVAGKSSSYVAPLAARADRKGELTDLAQRLRAARDSVRKGGTLLEACADGTLWGWRTRIALSHALAYGENLADWDSIPSRTQAERLLLVERVLRDLGAE